MSERFKGKVKTEATAQAIEMKNLWTSDEDKKAVALLAWWDKALKTLGKINRNNEADVKKVQDLLDAVHEKFHNISGFVACYELHRGINGSPEQKALLGRLQKMMIYGDNSISSLEGIQGVNSKLTKLSSRRKKTT